MSRGVQAQSSILLVEDEPLVRGALADVLRDERMIVTVAGSAEAAVVALERLGPGLTAVLSDLQLPGCDGLWLLSQCQARWPALQRVLTSGLTSSIFVSALATSLVDVFLPKPIDLDDLVAALSMRHPPVAKPGVCSLCRGRGVTTSYLSRHHPPEQRLCIVCGGRGLAVPRPGR